jgi:FKBP-type peptidyl-prolyl cis-trans isomerase (trigger factor)
MAKKIDAITTTLKGTEKNQALVEVVVSAQTAEAARQEAVGHMAESVTIKGFRRGKAPVALVEKELDPQKVLEHAVNHLLPDILSTALKNHQLKPLTNPRINLVAAKKGEEWKFELDVPVQPEIDTKDFKEYIHGELAVASILTLDKAAEETSKEQTDEEKLKKLLDALLKKYQFEVPQLLIEDEINRSLSRLLNQVQTLGLNLEDYLKSIGKTGEQLRAEYQGAAQDNLRLEIILARLGQEMKIEVLDADIEAMIKSAGDEKTQKQLSTPEQKQYIGEIIRKRKTIDALLTL